MPFPPPPADGMAVDDPPPDPHSAPKSHGPPSEDAMAVDDPPPNFAPTPHDSPLLEEEEEEEEDDVRMKPCSARASRAGRGAGVRAWSPEVEEMKSSLDRNKLLSMCRKFGISEEKYRAFCPEGEDGGGPCKTPPERSVCVYKDMLEVGVRFPLHDFYTKILRHYRIAPSQLTPNAWRYLIGFVLVCDGAKVEGASVKPTVPIFQQYFKLGATPGNKLRGWYSFLPQAHLGHRFFSNAAADNYGSLDGWKKSFFFLESCSVETAWLCPTKWGKPSQRSLKTPVLDTAKEAIEKLESHIGKSLRSVLSQCDKFPVKEGPACKLRTVSSIIDLPPQQLPVAVASSSSPPPPPELGTPEPDPERPVRADSRDPELEHSQIFMDKMSGAYKVMQRIEENLRRVKEELKEEKSKHATDVAQLTKELGAAKAEHTAQVAKLCAEKAKSEATLRQLTEELETVKTKASKLAENFRVAEAKHAAEVKDLNDKWQRKVTMDARRQSSTIICAALRETRSAVVTLRETCSAVVDTIEDQLVANYPTTEPEIDTPPPGFLPRQELQEPVNHVVSHQTVKQEVVARQGTEGTNQTMEDLMMRRCPSTNPAIM